MNCLNSKRQEIGQLNKKDNILTIILKLHLVVQPFIRFKGESWDTN